MNTCVLYADTTIFSLNFLENSVVVPFSFFLLLLLLLLFIYFFTFYHVLLFFYLFHLLLFFFCTFSLLFSFFYPLWPLNSLPVDTSHPFSKRQLTMTTDQSDSLSNVSCLKRTRKSFFCKLYPRFYFSC